MPITHKLVGIAASTLPALPIDLTRLTAHSPGLTFLPPQFGLLFCFQKGGDDRVDSLQGNRFGLLLHFLEDACSFLPLEFPL